MHFIQSIAVCLSLGVLASAGHPSDIFKRAKKYEQKPRVRAAPPVNAPKLAKRDVPFLTDKTKSFSVNGTGIPDVPFDIGTSYAGLMPISDSPDETRKLYFWFFPTTNPNATEEITFWFNGGPGCSSLSGLLTENGPFTWEAGTLAPVQNPYTWVNLTNMVWIEQPIGVGFTQGTPNITNEVELGQEFVGFYKQFSKTFDLRGRDIYLTGESYGGYYVPYIADAILKENSTEMPLGGIAINDPIIADGTMQQHTVMYDYVEYWNKLLYLNDTFIDALKNRSDECGYTSFMEKYFKFPPPAEKYPVLPDPYATENGTCAQFDNALNAILLVNPCFNLYHISETCPHPYSQLGIVNSGDYSPPGAEVYFNRTDVQKAINAPVGTNWEQCTSGNVFGLGDGNSSRSDTSLGPAQNGVLEHVIECTNNVIIGSGNLDMLISTNGTLLAIQNMTWNGMQGLQEYPGKEFYVPDHPEYNGGALTGSGLQGYWGTERGLTFYQVQLAGHELPGYTAGAGYRSIELLLGRIESLSDRGTFTTQSGNFTGNTTLYR
ncbi:serine carboxypeptidase like protein [Zymoseptoria brevis]|uniref:Carboxypeptidase n=1 Tax=Zymoseptoria brevis TaxID=1047168 RepID=A0A0F4G771_9PEZI|nr:serine carboxypeptidase like protein [Zymoseptoria brevis]